MQIDLFAQVTNRHRRALDMPARTTRPPRTCPLRLPRLRTLPQGEVHRVLFLHPNVRRLCRDHVLQRSTRQLAVARHLTHAVVHIAARRIRHPLLNQPVDQVDHLWDLLGRPRMHIGRRNPQLPPLPHERRYLPLRQLRDSDPLLRRTSDQLVVDVGEVVHETDPPSPPLEESAQGVEDDDRHRMAQVRVVVWRDPADVHRNRIIDRLKRLFATCQRVVQLHGPTPKLQSIVHSTSPSGEAVPKSLPPA